jgi:hypothetical protein
VLKEREIRSFASLPSFWFLGNGGAGISKIPGGTLACFAYGETKY